MTTKGEKLPSKRKKGPLRVGKCPLPQIELFSRVGPAPTFAPPPPPAGVHEQM